MMTIHKTPNPNRWSLNPPHPMLFNANLFGKPRFQNVFCPRWNTEPRFEERFREAPCSWQIKVAEHSFRARFRWCNFARAQGFQKTSLPSIERLFYLLNTRTHWVIFLYNWTQCIDGFSLLLQRYVRKGNDAKNPANFGFCLLPKEPS